MATVIVVAGPNGAGKTTLARELLLRRLPDEFTFLNADLIAEGLSPFKPLTVAAQAGREFLRRFDALAREGRSFVLESTLAGGSLRRRLGRIQERGYRVEVVYLWLPKVELALQRVAQRTRRGGHAIPEATVRRRFERSFPSFLTRYASVADSWTLLDGSATPPVTVARELDGRALEVIDGARFRSVVSTWPGLGDQAWESEAQYGEAERGYLDDLEPALEAVGNRLRELAAAWGE